MQIVGQRANYVDRFSSVFKHSSCRTNSSFLKDVPQDSELTEKQIPHKNTYSKINVSIKTHVGGHN